MLRDIDSPEHLALTDEIGEVDQQGRLKALPDELRTAILLREIEGMSYEEIAQAMDCPVGTVRSRIFRAREAIDKKLKPSDVRTGMSEQFKEQISEFHRRRNVA